MSDTEKSFEPAIATPTSRAYSQYDVHNPPTKPTEGNWTRFVCISDTHEHEFDVPIGDVLLHGGDLTHVGREEGCRSVLRWLSSLPHPHKIIIAGNHDLSFHDGWYQKNYRTWHREMEDTQTIKSMFTDAGAKKANITYLEDASCEVQVRPGGKSWTVYGSPWQPEFWNWAFNYARGAEAEEIVSKFPKADILITHGPPHGVLDQVMAGLNVGCEALAARLPELRPRLHLFGHIHEAHGLAVQEWEHAEKTLTTEKNKVELAEGVPHTIFANAASWPMGKLVREGQEFGAGAFMPIIVDLRED
ncbi:unnamed protein product [Peniophora sp. CBMAI 1063]|nr:unnamed protein product [Peniophora sp. CBMAI 1063]